MFKKDDVLISNVTGRKVTAVADQIGSYIWVVPDVDSLNPYTEDASKYTPFDKDADNYKIGTILRYPGSISCIAVKQHNFDDSYKKWFVVQSGKIEGPMTYDEMKARVRSHVNGPEEVFLPEEESV